MTNDYRKRSVWWSIGLAAGFVVLFLCLDDRDKTVVNFFSFFGTSASLAGLAWAYFGILSVKSTAEETKKAVENSISRLNQVLSLSDISRAVQITEEVRGYLRHKQYDCALLRMKDLRYVMVHAKYNQVLSEHTSKNRYSQQVTTLGVDILSVSNDLGGLKTGVDYSVIGKNLESIAVVLIEFENKLKYQNA